MPSQASGQAPKPKGRYNAPVRKPRAVSTTERAVHIGKRVVKAIESLNPFD